MISLKTDRYVADDLEKTQVLLACYQAKRLALLLPALIALLWHIAAAERWMPEQILPAPAVVADTALSLLSGDLLAQWGLAFSTWPSGCCWVWRRVLCWGRCLVSYRPRLSG
jgi:hypothetical protein